MARPPLPALTRSQGLKIGSRIAPQNNRFAVEHRVMDRQRCDGVSDACEGVAVVGRGAGPKVHLLAVFAGDDAVAVELDPCSQPGPAGGLSASADWHGRMEAVGLGT